MAPQARPRELIIDVGHVRPERARLCRESRSGRASGRSADRLTGPASGLTCGYASRDLALIGTQVR